MSPDTIVRRAGHSLYKSCNRSCRCATHVDLPRRLPEVPTVRAAGLNTPASVHGGHAGLSSGSALTRSAVTLTNGCAACRTL
jgi:hypothetical protein